MKCNWLSLIAESTVETSLPLSFLKLMSEAEFKAFCCLSSAPNGLTSQEFTKAFGLLNNGGVAVLSEISEALLNKYQVMTTTKRPSDGVQMYSLKSYEQFTLDFKVNVVLKVLIMEALQRNAGR